MDNLKKKIIVYGVNDNSICFDFEEHCIYLFRKGWASNQLKLSNIKLPFEKITAIELIKPQTWSTGRITIIVDGVMLLANDPQFENNSSELSLNDKMYDVVKEAVNAVIAENSNIQLLTTGSLGAPKEKKQNEYVTPMDDTAFIGDGKDVLVVKGGGASVGFLLGALVICVVLCILILKMV